MILYKFLPLHKSSEKMSKKEIQLLDQQIEKLTAKEFDLEAWKKYTIIILWLLLAMCRFDEISCFCVEI